MSGLNGQREEYERRANALREKLLHTIEAIERRRHTLLDVKHQVRSHAGGLAISGMTLALVGTGLAAAGMYRRHTRDARLRRERMRAFGRLWRHPDWIAPRTQRSVLWEIGRKVLVGTTTFLAVELIRRGVRMALTVPPEIELPARRPLQLGA